MYDSDASPPSDSCRPFSKELPAHVAPWDPQVLWPQVLTLGVMLATVVLTLKVVSGNAFMAFILAAQLVLGITNATIVGGVYQLASWLPATYIQVFTFLRLSAAMALPLQFCDFERLFFGWLIANAALP